MSGDKKLSPKDKFEILQNISGLLNTGLDPEALAICVKLIEGGVNSDSFLSIVNLLKSAKGETSQEDKEAKLKSPMGSNPNVKSPEDGKPKEESVNKGYRLKCGKAMYQFPKQLLSIVEFPEVGKPKEESINKGSTLTCGKAKNEFPKELSPIVESPEHSQELNDEIPKKDFLKGIETKLEPVQNIERKYKLLKFRPYLKTVIEAESEDESE